MFNGPEIHDNILVQVESSVHNEQDEPMWIRKKSEILIPKYPDTVKGVVRCQEGKSECGLECGLGLGSTGCAFLWGHQGAQPLCSARVGYGVWH